MILENFAVRQFVHRTCDNFENFAILQPDHMISVILALQLVHLLFCDLCARTHDVLLNCNLRTNEFCNPLVRTHDFCNPSARTH